MAASGIRADICRELSGEDQEAALGFVRILEDQQLTFRRDDSPFWRSRIYYHVRLGEECVCFIAVADPDEPDNRWTVWSADMGSRWLAAPSADAALAEAAWRYVDRCGHCGSCGGGRQRIIFGRAFNDVCGCTFRVDNPQNVDLPFLTEMIGIRIRELRGE